MNEFELIRRYFDRAADADGVVVGVGDDGAVLRPAPGKHQVNVIDTLVEGVHFPKNLKPHFIGFRAVAVNLSDIAAMGAVPRWMTLALSIPRAEEAWLHEFADGLYAASAEYGVELVGGDTTMAPLVVTTVQMNGELDPGTALLRSGAQPGDTIYVTGTVGDAAAGLYGLQHDNPVPELVKRFSQPSPRVSYGRRLVGIASAAIDISDGLCGDLDKLLTASGVGAKIDLERLPISAELRANFEDDQQLEFALNGGDDYELCFTTSLSPPDAGAVCVTAIGTITERKGLVGRLAGKIVPIDDGGYDHFG